MCQYKVFLRSPTGNAKVAEDVIEIVCRDGDTLLIDVLGETVRVENAIVESVKVSGERVDLISHPILGLVLRLTRLHNMYMAGSASKESVIKLWEELKERGDQIFYE